MENKKFEVMIYYSGFCTYEVEAFDEAEAIFKAQKLPVKKSELLSNLENWEEANTANILTDEKRKN